MLQTSPTYPPPLFQMVSIRLTPSVYSSEQLEAYLARLHLQDVPRDATLSTLTKIMRAQLIAFPFENTDIH